jgi:signal transduction histidine kinase
MTPDASGRLLSVLSHELRSPLGVIRGYLRLLQDPAAALSDQHRSAISAALRAADHAARLLDQASYLAQFRRGDLQLDLTRVDMTSVLDAAIQAVAAAPDLAITCDAHNLTGTVVAASRNQLRDALTSLIAAVTRAQLPPCTIEVRAQRRRDGQAEGLRLHIEVAGLAGQRVEGPLNIDRGGLGLDLPIAEAVIALHRGRVSELTAVGRCVGLIVWLPVAP